MLENAENRSIGYENPIAMKADANRSSLLLWKSFAWAYIKGLKIVYGTKTRAIVGQGKSTFFEGRGVPYV